MVRAIDEALDDWRDDPDVELVVIDAAGKKAFSAGGDLAEMHKTGTAGDFDYGRRFWADEYRLNAKIANYPKPYVAFCQGFTMGGGVGVSLHGSHRIVCESSSIAMPECAVGLVPDVGGPVPSQIEGKLKKSQREFDRIFASPLAQMWEGAWTASFAASFAKMTDLASPLSMACAVELIRRARQGQTIEAALTQEYNFTHRVMEHGDFLEGIRSVIIDKDRDPKWKHASIREITETEVEAMLADLGVRSLILS